MEDQATLTIKLPRGLKLRLQKAAREEGHTLSSFLRHHLARKVAARGVATTAAALITSPLDISPTLPG